MERTAPTTLTPRGWAVALTSLLSWAAAWWLGRPELAVVGLGGGFAMLAAGLSIARPTPVEVSRDLAPARVTRGDPAIAVLTCTRSGRPGWAALRAVDRFGTAGAVVETAVELPHAGSGEASTTSYAVPTGRRGPVAVGPLRLVHTDPWGLARRTRSVGDSRTLLVLPRTVTPATTPSGRMPNPDGPGADRAAGSTVFHALRQYEFGDDLRQIHWRTSARIGTLMVRNLVDTSLPWTVVVLDDRAGAYADPDDFETAVDVAASVAAAAARQGFPVLLACGDRLIISGNAAPASVLDELSAVVLSTEPHDDRRPLAGIQSWRGRGALALVTGTSDPTALTGAARIRERFDTTTAVRVGTQTNTAATTFPFPVMDISDLTGFAAAWQRGASR